MNSRVIDTTLDTAIDVIYPEEIRRAFSDIGKRPMREDFMDRRTIAESDRVCGITCMCIWTHEDDMEEDHAFQIGTFEAKHNEAIEAVLEWACDKYGGAYAGAFIKGWDGVTTSVCDFANMEEPLTKRYGERLVRRMCAGYVDGFLAYKASVAGERIEPFKIPRKSTVGDILAQHYDGPPEKLSQVLAG